MSHKFTQPHSSQRDEACVTIKNQTLRAFSLTQEESFHSKEDRNFIVNKHKSIMHGIASPLLAI